MAKRWTEEDEDFLREYYPIEGAKACAEVLDRTEGAIRHKAEKLNIKFIRKDLWSDEEVKVLIKHYSIEGLKYCVNILGKSSSSVIHKANRLKLYTKCAGNIFKTTEKYKEELKNTEFEVLEEYKGSHKKILHKHKICGYIWAAEPSNILQGYGCPNCANYGFQPNKPAQLYFIYFKELNLYKIGITNNFDRRKKEFGYISEIIQIKDFKLGSEAYILEQKILKELKPFLVNTGKLKSGNTETLFEPPLNSILDMLK
jgi:hypothetical protein